MIGWIILIFAIWYIFNQRANICAFVARASIGNGDFELAMKIYDFAYKIGKMKFGNNLDYAYFALKTGDIDKADKLFNLLRMSPLKPVEKMQLKATHALVFWKRGDVETAIEMLEEAVNKMPNTTFYGSLGYMYIYNNQFTEALELNKKAYEYNSNDLIILENLALTYFKLGEMDQAKIYYEKLMGMNPVLPDCLYEYGQFLLKCGDTEKAKESFKKALDGNFSFLTMVTREEIQREIDNLTE